MENNAFFKNKVVVITGATAGLGRAIARAMGERGAKVALLARGEDGLEGTRNDIESLGGQALAIPTDVGDAAQVEAAADQVEETWGAIDIWINNAMNSVFAPLKEIKPAEFKRVTDVTYLGQVYGTMAALKRMIPRNKGSIALVGSALAYRGIPLQSAYCGAKHGIHGFFESLRAELIHDNSNIHLTMIQMPAMNTPQFEWVLSRLPNKPKPMGTIYQPEVAAKGVLYAIEHEKREVFVGFPTWKTIIGNKFIPGWLDGYLARTGYKGQQTDEPKSPNRQNNLWEPVPGDHGAHSNFNAQAWDFSPGLWIVTHKWLTFAGLAALAAGIGFGIGRAQKKNGVQSD